LFYFFVTFGRGSYDSKSVGIDFSKDGMIFIKFEESS